MAKTIHDLNKSDKEKIISQVRKGMVFLVTTESGQWAVFYNATFPLPLDTSCPGNISLLHRHGRGSFHFQVCSELGNRQGLHSMLEYICEHDVRLGAPADEINSALIDMGDIIQDLPYDDMSENIQRICDDCWEWSDVRKVHDCRDKLAKAFSLYGDQIPADFRSKSMSLVQSTLESFEEMDTEE